MFERSIQMVYKINEYTILCVNAAVAWKGQVNYSDRLNFLTKTGPADYPAMAN